VAVGGACDVGPLIHSSDSPVSFADRAVSGQIKMDVWASLLQLWTVVLL
jgi:hypothetical protein